MSGEKNGSLTSIYHLGTMLSWKMTPN